MTTPCWRWMLLTLLCAGNTEGQFFSPSARTGVENEVIYFLMPDRFNDGNAANNLGGYPSADEAGFDPENIAAFHGGDLSGIEQRLDYIRALGATAIWMTPILRNRPFQVYDSGKKIAGYHGYWITDFTRIDPHFGTGAELKSLIDAGAAQGLKAIFDIVVNHTADIIQPKSGTTEYQYKFSKPYLDAGGHPFDDRDFIGRADFPKLDPEKSFPVPPTFRNAGDASVKVPGWLNDPTLYHNRGNAQTGGESALYGDIAGLDDLFTEHPAVIAGLRAIYERWIRDFGLAGFRLDTVKHVNNEFWLEFVPRMRETAQAGRPDFFVFGEVYDPDPAACSEFVHRAAMPSLLDFGFQQAIREFSIGRDAPARLKAVLEKDDYYTTPTGNAYQLVTFTGNHDYGRLGYALRSYLPDAEDVEIYQRVVLGHALMLFSRGVPVIYYGDEQGFAGTGPDVLARQDMFGSKSPEFRNEKRIGGGSGEDSAFHQDHPLFREFQKQIRVRRDYETLRVGTQVTRVAEEQSGVFAFSRIHPSTREEFLVVLNNATEQRAVPVPTSATSTAWEQVFRFSDDAMFSADTPGNVHFQMPPLSVIVLKCLDPIGRPTAPGLGPLGLVANRSSEIEDRWLIEAESQSDQLLTVAFAVKSGESWKFLGADDAPPYRVFPTRDAIPKSAEIQFKAIARDLFGNEASAEYTWQRRRK